MLFSDLNHQDDSGSRSFSRAGLYFGQTGIPVFVLATTHAADSAPFEIQDSSVLWQRIPTDEHLVDRLAHHAVQGFFSLGGKRLVVLLIHVDPATEDLNSEYLRQVVGEDSGYLKRSGYHALRNHDAVADLIVFPQAPMVLSAQELLFLYQNVLQALASYLPVFLIMDSPCYSTPEKVADWAQPLDSSLGALFYPWISIPEVGFLPVSVLVAAFLQSLDQKLTLAESPANHALPKSFKLLVELDQDQVKDLTSRQINVLRRMANDDAVLWGTYTFARDKAQDSLIQYVRTLRSIQDALTRICEPHVMSPRTASTCERMEEEITQFLDKLKQEGVLANLENSFSCECALSSKRMQWDASISVFVEVVLERPEDRIGINFQI